MTIYPAPLVVWAYYAPENDAPWAELVLGWFEDGAPAVWHVEQDELVDATGLHGFARLVPEACLRGYPSGGDVAWAIREAKGENLSTELAA